MLAGLADGTHPVSELDQKLGDAEAGCWKG